MSAVESAFCRSAPWAVAARRVVLPWALHGSELHGDVLELGCGSGAMAAAVAHDHPSVRLTATDLDPKMVAATEQRLAGWPNASARVADVTRLPFDDRSFDLVTSYLMLHHVIEWEQAVSEALRVLRPGGRLVGYDLDDTLAARAVHISDRSPFRLVPAPRLDAELRAAGFVDAAVKRSLGRHAYRFSATRPREE